MPTSEQFERLLGLIVMGTATETACELVGVTYVELFAHEDSDAAFRLARFLAQAARDDYLRQRDRLSE